MVSIAGTGAQQLAVLGLKLKAAGDGRLRRDLLAGLRSAAGPVVPALRQAARDELPKKGGLNEWVANSPIQLRNSLSPFTAGVSIVNLPAKPSGKRGGTIQFGTDKGAVRHPVFGHTDRWAVTTFQAGWFSKTIEAKLPEVAAEMQVVLNSIGERLVA